MSKMKLIETVIDDVVIHLKPMIQWSVKFVLYCFITSTKQLVMKEYITYLTKHEFLKSNLALFRDLVFYRPSIIMISDLHTLSGINDIFKSADDMTPH